MAIVIEVDMGHGDKLAIRADRIVAVQDTTHNTTTSAQPANTAMY